jgi:predicted nicotinamide N-methyase
LIIAGDVFYDREIAQLFAALVKQVSTPGVTKVLVAQKLRKNADNVAVAMISEAEIRVMFGYESIALVRAEADVLLWSMLAC